MRDDIVPDVDGHDADAAAIPPEAKHGQRGDENLPSISPVFVDPRGRRRLWVRGAAGVGATSSMGFIGIAALLVMSAPVVLIPSLLDQTPGGDDAVADVPPPEGVVRVPSDLVALPGLRIASPFESLPAAAMAVTPPVAPARGIAEMLRAAPPPPNGRTGAAPTTGGSQAIVAPAAPVAAPPKIAAPVVTLPQSPVAPADPPVTPDPPTPDPPTPDPPVTDPPVTDPPATDPPVTVDADPPETPAPEPPGTSESDPPATPESPAAISVQPTLTT